MARAPIANVTPFNLKLLSLSRLTLTDGCKPVHLFVHFWVTKTLSLKPVYFRPFAILLACTQWHCAGLILP